MEEKDDFYAAGRKLAEQIADSKSKEVSIASLQALIRDFLPRHEEMQEALRSIVTRPDFLELAKLAGSEKGGAQKYVCLERLRKVYSTETVAVVDRLVCGMLGLGIDIISDSPNGNSALIAASLAPSEYINSRERDKEKGSRTKESQARADTIDNSGNPKWTGFVGFD